MSVAKFWVENRDDETVELFIGEKSVGTFDHDSHGYSSMRDVVKLFEAISKEVGAKFEQA